MIAESPRWLVDEMLGRLARYLRFFGHDAEYVRGGGDDAIAARARAEGRVLLTRDRRLAQRVEGALWIHATGVDDQLLAVHLRFPQFSYSVAFDRCTACNGRLERVAGGDVDELRPAVPPSVRASTVSVYACRDCRHPYWEGSHTAHIRARVERLFANP